MRLPGDAAVGAGVDDRLRRVRSKPTFARVAKREEWVSRPRPGAGPSQRVGKSDPRVTAVRGRKKVQWLHRLSYPAQQPSMGCVDRHEPRKFEIGRLHLSPVSPTVRRTVYRGRHASGDHAVARSETLNHPNARAYQVWLFDELALPVPSAVGGLEDGESWCCARRAGHQRPPEP